MRNINNLRYTDATTLMAESKEELKSLSLRVKEESEEAEVEWFYEDLQDLLEPTHKKDVLCIIGDWNAKVRCQETPGVTGKFGLGMRNEAGRRLIEFCQEMHWSFSKF